MRSWNIVEIYSILFNIFLVIVIKNDYQIIFFKEEIMHIIDKIENINK